MDELLIAKIVAIVGIVLFCLKCLADAFKKIADYTENKVDDKIAYWLGKICGFLSAVIDQITANSRPSQAPAPEEKK